MNKENKESCKQILAEWTICQHVQTTLMDIKQRIPCTKGDYKKSMYKTKTQASIYSDKVRRQKLFWSSSSQLN